MNKDDDPGEALEEVNRIRPAVDRLRKLLRSATLLDLKANADCYWASRDQNSDLARHPGDDLAVQ